MNEAATADPTFLNRMAWNIRWTDRKKSADAAQVALEIGRSRDTAGCESASAHRTLSWQAKWRGDFDGAMEHALACEAAVTETEAPELRGDCYSILGVIHYSRNRLDLAEHATKRGLGLGDLPDATWIDLMMTRATVQRYKGQLGKSGITLIRARERAHGVELARVEHNLARWMSQHGDPEGAMTHAERSIALSHEFQNRVILPYALEVAGSVAASLGQDEVASRHFRKGIEMAVEDDDMRVLCQLLYVSAKLEGRRGDRSRALDQINYGARIAEDMNYPLWQKNFALVQAEVLEANGDLAGALAAHKSAWSLQNAYGGDIAGTLLRSN